MDYAALEKTFNDLRDEKAKALGEKAELLKEPTELAKRRDEYLKNHVSLLPQKNIDDLIRKNEKAIRSMPVADERIDAATNATTSPAASRAPRRAGTPGRSRPSLRQQRGRPRTTATMPCIRRIRIASGGSVNWFTWTRIAALLLREQMQLSQEISVRL